MERNIDNAKYMMCVVTDMEGTIKMFQEDNMPKDLDQDESKSILEKKRPELEITRYVDRENKIK